MTSTSTYHYVYRITNLVENKHYYGKRSSYIEPKLDLGFRYFSSSRDDQFILDQKINPSHYRYKVIRLFKRVQEATIYEIKLHNLFDVGRNPRFYNKAKQTSTKFDTSGTIRSQEVRHKQSQTSKNHATYKDKNGNSVYLRTDDPSVLSGEVVSSSSGANNSRSKYIYITPYGETDTPAGLLHKMSRSCLWNMCMNKDRIITIKVYAKHTFLREHYSKEECLGKTFADFGFGLRTY